MAALGPAELEILDFLCAAAFFRCRVKRLKLGPADALRRLRYAGLVGLEGFEPSPWAFNDWLERQNGERLIEIIRETPARAPDAQPARPPEPEAAIAEGGGADARCADAPPPDRDPDPSGLHASPDRGAGESPRPPLKSKKRKSRGVSGKARKASSAKESTLAEAAQAAERISDRAPLPEPALPRAVPAHPPRRDPTQPPPDYRSQPQTEFHAGLVAAKGKNRRAAEARLDAGKRPEDEPGVSMRITMRQIQRERAEVARLADPIEQAKTLIRRKTRSPVFGAEYSDPPGPKGQFYVGRKLMSSAELLAYAERLAA